ncbi:MAG: hypothetical protein ACI9W1_003413, partial [Candidatus Azotimanducaceae bacterium]
FSLMRLFCLVEVDDIYHKTRSPSAFTLLTSTYTMLPSLPKEQDRGLVIHSKQSMVKTTHRA